MTAEPGHEATSASEKPTVRLILTGERRPRRVQVVVDGTPLWLTFGQLSILVRLIIARSRMGTGFVCDPQELYPKCICGLRKVFDAVRAGAGNEFIETGAGEEYRLKFLPKGRVRIDDNLLELLPLGILARDSLDYLCSSFGNGNRQEISSSASRDSHGN